VYALLPPFYTGFDQDRGLARFNEMLASLRKASRIRRLDAGSMICRWISRTRPNHSTILDTLDQKCRLASA
jgi:hypothetical protein